MYFRIHFDGACNNKQEHPNMGIGIAVFVDNEYQEDLSKFVGVKGDFESSSNVAEWIGCVEAFKMAYEYAEKGDRVEIYSDSQLITHQFNGHYEIRQEKFKEYYRQAKRWYHMANLARLQIKWVPRQQNKEADALSKKGLQSIS
jgi:ribonuclease HI